MKLARYGYALLAAGFCCISLCSASVSAVSEDIAKSILKSLEGEESALTAKKCELEDTLCTQNSQFDELIINAQSNELILEELTLYDTHSAQMEQDADRLGYDAQNFYFLQTYGKNIEDLELEVIDFRNQAEQVRAKMERTEESQCEIENRLETINNLMSIWYNADNDVYVGYHAAVAEAEYYEQALEDARQYSEQLEKRHEDVLLDIKQQKDDALEAEKAIDTLKQWLNHTDSEIPLEYLLVNEADFMPEQNVEESCKIWNLEIAKANHAAEVGQQLADSLDDFLAAEDAYISQLSRSLQHAQDNTKSELRYLNWQELLNTDVSAQLYDDSVRVSITSYFGQECDAELPLRAEIHDSSAEPCLCDCKGDYSDGIWNCEYDYDSLDHVVEPLFVTLYFDWNGDSKYNDVSELVQTQTVYLNSIEVASDSIPTPHSTEIKSSKNILKILFSILGGIGVFLLASIIIITIIFKTSVRKK